MMATRSRQRGFTITELLVVLLVVAVLAAISVPKIGNWLREYRLGIAAQQVADSLQSTKMQAVAKTRKRELLFDVAGNRLGQEGATLEGLPSGVSFGVGAATSPPEPSVTLDEPVSFPTADDGGTGDLRAAAFTGKGLPDANPGEVFAVFVSNDAGTRVVTMTSAGNIRIRSWDGIGWK